MKPSFSEFLIIRGLRYHVRQWGQAGAPKLFLVHGYLDNAATFQFVIDCLQRDWHVIAPDLRGNGLTAHSAADSYWFADYVGDLDAISRHYSPEDPIHLLGHSMGGNIASVYAGVRPGRVRKLVMLESFGLPAGYPEQAPMFYDKWLDNISKPPPAAPTFATQADVIRRLKKNNPRLTDARASFLAAHCAFENAAGTWQMLGDPARTILPPLRYHVEDILACWKNISAPTLWVEAADTDIWNWMGPRETARLEIDRRKSVIADMTPVTIEDAGHMLHHDQPQQVADLIEQFIAD